MKAILVLSVIIVSILMGMSVSAAPLNKYSDEFSSPSTAQQLSPNTIKQRLNNKMRRSVQILNGLEDDEKKRWIEKYEKKFNQAFEAGDYLKASYYKGILDQVK